MEGVEAGVMTSIKDINNDYFLSLRMEYFSFYNVGLGQNGRIKTVVM